MTSSWVSNVGHMDRRQEISPLHQPWFPKFNKAHLVNVNDLHSFATLLIKAVAKDKPEKLRPERDSNPDPCHVGAVL